MHNKMATWRRGKFGVCALFVQMAFLVLFMFFVKYKKSANASYKGNSQDPSKGVVDPGSNDIGYYYPMFQDVHVMMFIGFGFLMTFLKRYGYGSVGLNFFVASIVLQWATLVSGFFHLEDGKIHIDIVSLLYSDFAAAAVLISFGAVLGKTSPLQLMIMALIEIPFFQCNEWIGVTHFGAVDVGGSMFVHVFGAYFGVTVAKVINDKNLYKSPAKEKDSTHYHSDLFAMVGSIFLWVFWPSFNSAVAAPGDDQHRAVLNTYFSLAACTVTTFLIVSLLDKEDKFGMDYIQNSTLAGGVAVGTMADLMIEPWGAIVVGMVAAIVSVLGFHYLSPFLINKLHIHDTCGVNNLHGMPGIVAGLGGIVVTYLASEDQYGLSLYQIFPHRAPMENTTELLAIQANFSSIEAGDGWSAGRQAGMQAAALGVSIGMALVGGLITGLVLKLPIWNQPEHDDIYEDEPFWILPEEGLPHVYLDGMMMPNKGDNPSITQPYLNKANGVEHVEVSVKSADTKI